MRRRIAVLVMAACVVVTGAPARGEHDRFTPSRTTLPFDRVADLVLAPDDQHVYATGGRGSDEIFEVDRDGRVVRRLDGLGGVGDVVLDGDRLWAAAGEDGVIAEVSRRDLRVLNRYSTAPYDEVESIAKLGDTIYFNHGCRSLEREPGLAALDLQTGAVRNLEPLEHEYCPVPLVPAHDSDTLVTWTPIEDVLRVYRLTAAAPILLREAQFSRVYEVELSEGFAFVLEQRELHKVDLLTLESVATNSVPEGSVRMALEPAGGALAVVGTFNETTIHRTSDLHVVRNLHSAGANPTRIALFDGARKAITAGENTVGADATRLFVVYDRQVVRATRAVELAPAAGGGHLAWAAGTGRRGKLNVYVKSGDGRRRRVNRRGTEAWSGAVDRNRLIYAEGRRGRWDLKLYDLERNRRSDAPRRVNTRRSREWRPSLSGRWILFSRARGQGYFGGSVLLYDRRTGKMRTLQRGPRRALLFADQVNGRYATWSVCKRNCRVYRYDIQRRRKTRIRNRWKSQFGASVTRDGTLYYGVSGNGCGNGAGIVRDPARGGPRMIARVWGGHDIDRTYVEPGRTGPPRIYYTEYTCNGFNPDIYFIEDP